MQAFCRPPYGTLDVPASRQSILCILESRGEVARMSTCKHGEAACYPGTLTCQCFMQNAATTQPLLENCYKELHTESVPMQSMHYWILARPLPAEMLRMKSKGCKGK